MFQITDFAYAPANLEAYESSLQKTQHDGFIIHVDKINTDDLLLFIINTKFPLIMNLWEEVIERIDEVPMPGVVFGVDLGVDGIFRAVRNADSPQVLVILIDSGKILNLSALKNGDKFKLSREAQSFPACAIPCKVTKIFDCDEKAIPIASADMTSLLHDTIKFVVMAIDQPQIDMITIHIYKKQPTRDIVARRSSMKPFTEEELKMSPENVSLDINSQFEQERKRNQNDDRRAQCVANNDRVAVVNRYSPEAYGSNKTNDLTPSSTQNVKFNLATENPTNGTVPKMESDAVTFTREELEELFEQPLNTSNPLKAIMGYAPKDDERICHFYNPKTGKCYKGNNCHFEHVAILKDGWTRDRCAIKSKIFSIQPSPKANDVVNIVPLKVVSVEEIYAYVHCVSGITPKKLKELMNTSENRRKYKPIRKFPEIFDLILVKHIDDKFYRAKVNDVIDDKIHSLFYVDYGFVFEIGMNRMYEWSDYWDYVPYLVHRCYLVDVKMRMPNDTEAINELNKRIIFKKVEALIVSSTDELFVRLFDENGCDIGQLLCANKFAENGKYVPLPIENDEQAKQNQYVPG